MKFAIVVPVYKEEEIIEEFVRTVEQEVKGDWTLVLVDDGSDDNTPAILSKLKKEYPNLVVLTHEVNKGLGMALKTGIEYAREYAEVVITMDSDLTHPPALIDKMVSMLVKSESDVCIASRYVKDGGMEDVPGWRVVISKIANLMFRKLFGIKARDITAGYKSYRSYILKDLNITKPGFVVQLEIMVKLAKKGARFVEIPLMLVNRKKGNSKFRFFKMLPKYAIETTKLFFYRWLG